MSNRIHIAAAANQLNRKLFDDSAVGGSIIVSNDNLEVTVYGAWGNRKIANFAGYPVSWRTYEAA